MEAENKKMIDSRRCLEKADNCAPSEQLLMVFLPITLRTTSLIINHFDHMGGTDVDYTV